jgi:manganese/zinc/iron transport system substrate-binding protein
MSVEKEAPVAMTRRALLRAGLGAGAQVLALGAGASLIPGCTRVHDQRGILKGSPPWKMVATTGMVGDLVRGVGGSDVEVAVMMGPGVDPHLYKSGVRDVSLLGTADVIFYSGLHLEGKMAELFERLGERRRAIAVTHHFPKEVLHAEEGGEADPHVWFDVRLWARAAREVQRAMIELDPPRAQAYTERGNKYLRELNELDAWSRRELAQIPRERRVLVTAHDAFGYFGSAYGVEVMGLQGISTASEFGLSDVSGLVKLLAARRIKAVFVESSVSPRAIEAVVQGARARGHTVRIGGTLYSDAPGPPGTGADSYIGMVRHNVNTIVKALK